MIARLTGTLLEVVPPSVVIDVHGVGYEVHVPMGVFDRLPALGQSVTLLTEFIVREDAHTLYGFSTAADRQLFRDLLKVSGVGPRLALGILSGVSGQDFAWMVESGDVQALTKLPGIGKKTAERLLVEMKGRLAKLSGHEGVMQSQEGDQVAEARAALSALGYPQSEALKLVRQAAEGLGPEASAQALIKEALKLKMTR